MKTEDLELRTRYSRFVTVVEDYFVLRNNYWGDDTGCRRCTPDDRAIDIAVPYWYF